MSVDREEIVPALLPDEINYPAAARFLGDEAELILTELVQGDDVVPASRAATLAKHLSSRSARPVLESAAVHQDPVVRVAAAAALQEQAEIANDLAGSLLRDPDAGVRKWALRSLQALKLPGWRQRVDEMATHEEVPAIKKLAREAARQLP